MVEENNDINKFWKLDPLEAENTSENRFDWVCSWSVMKCAALTTSPKTGLSSIFKVNPIIQNDQKVIWNN